MGTLKARTFFVFLAFFVAQFLFGAQLSAQSTVNPVASASTFEGGVGYVFMNQTSASQPRISLNGLDANGLVRFTARWAGTIDFTYARAGNLPGTGHSDSVFSGLIGPVYYMKVGEETEVFVHGLIGIAWVDSAVPVGTDAIFKGYETRFSYALGGGVERPLFGPFAIRATADYQRTTFVDSTLSLQGQNNIRLMGSIQYRFGRRQW
ncbi:MAG TPA: hypothetical protein VHV29_16870 [Terriglobales bacterium]|nr:hypothetical protein [Terriglobales bacterium]